MPNQAKFFQPSVYANFAPLSVNDGKISAPILGPPPWQDFHLTAKIYDKSGKHLVSEFDIPCGSGEQQVRWLGLVVSQKLSNQVAARGRRRAFEISKLKEGFFLPSDIIDENGVPVDPTIKINGAFRNQSFFQVKVHTNFGNRWEPLVKLNSFGNPVLSSFHQRAFQTSTEAQESRRDPRNQRIFLAPTYDQEDSNRLEKYLETKIEQRGIYATCPVSGRKLSLGSHTKSANFRREMSRQMLYRNSFGLMTEDEHNQELTNTVEQEISFMKLDEIVQDEEEKIKIAEIFVKYFADLNIIFKSYCAYGDATSTTSMNFTEFIHMLSACNLFDEIHDRSMLKSIFFHTNLELVDDIENPDIEFLRFEFLESLIRLAKVKYARQPHSEGLATLLAEMKVPEMVAKMDLPAHHALMDRSVQCFLQDMRGQLYAVYHRYKTMRPSNHGNLSLQAFLEMLQDGSLLGLTKQQANRYHIYSPDLRHGHGNGQGYGQSQAKLAEREEMQEEKKHVDCLLRTARFVFASSQNDIDEHTRRKVEDTGMHIIMDEALEFTEFVEALVRLSMIKYHDTDQPAVSKVKLVVFNLSELHLKQVVRSPPRKGTILGTVVNKVGKRPNTLLNATAIGKMKKKGRELRKEHSRHLLKSMSLPPLAMEKGMVSSSMPALGAK